MRVVFVSAGEEGAKMAERVGDCLKRRGAFVEHIALSYEALSVLSCRKVHTVKDVKACIQNERPDVVVNERTGHIEWQNEVTRLCKQMGVANISLLDYSERVVERFESRPDVIVAPNESALRDLRLSGVFADGVVVGGNPTFDDVRRDTYKSKKRETKRILYVASGDEREDFSELYSSLKKLPVSFELDVKEQGEYGKFLGCRSIVRGKADVRVLKGVRDVVFKQRVVFWSLMGGWLLSDLPKLAGVLLLSSLWFLDKLERDEAKRQEKCFEEKLSEYDLVIGYGNPMLMRGYLTGVPTVFLELDKTDRALSRFVRGRKRVQIHPKADFPAESTGRIADIIESVLEKRKKEGDANEHTANKEDGTETAER